MRFGWNTICRQWVKKNAMCVKKEDQQWQHNNHLTREICCVRTTDRCTQISIILYWLSNDPSMVNVASHTHTHEPYTFNIYWSSSHSHLHSTNQTSCFIVAAACIFVNFSLVFVPSHVLAHNTKSTNSLANCLPSINSFSNKCCCVRPEPNANFHCNKKSSYCTQENLQWDENRRRERRIFFAWHFAELRSRKLILMAEKRWMEIMKKWWSIR